MGQAAGIITINCQNTYQLPTLHQRNEEVQGALILVPTLIFPYFKLLQNISNFDRFSLKFWTEEKFKQRSGA